MRMDLYNIKVDAQNFIKKNLKILALLNVIILIGAFLGCVVALSLDCQTVFETSGNAYFVFLTDTSVKGVAVNVFVSAVVYLALLVLSKAIKFTKKFGILLVCYKAYEVFYRMTIIMLYFGIKSIFPSVLICVAELVFCLLLETLYLLNNSEKRNLCKDWISEEYLITVGVIAFASLVVNVLICSLFNLLNFFT